MIPAVTGTRLTRRNSRYMRRLLCILWLSLGVFAASGELLAAVTVTDDLGQTVTLARPARRIVSLAPNITELLFAAGAGAYVVGATDYSDYPAQARVIPRVGGGGGIDLETVTALQPDLVIAWQSGSPAAQVQRLRHLGMPVFYSELRSLQDIPRSLLRFAQLAGTVPVARPAIDDFEHRLADLQARYAGRSPIRVFYQVWGQPLMTVNGAHLISDVLRLCGGVNVFADQPVLSGAVTEESVLALDPQVIVVAADHDDAGRLLASWRRWPQLEAVQSGQLYALPRELMVRMTPRILDGAEQLCALLERARTQR